MKYIILLSLVVAVVYSIAKEVDDQFYVVHKYHDNIVKAIEKADFPEIPAKAQESEECMVKEDNKTKVKYAFGNAFNQDVDLIIKQLDYTVTIHTLVIEVRCPSDKDAVKFYAKFTYSLPDNINKESFGIFSYPADITNKQLKELLKKSAEKPAGFVSN